MTEKTSLHILLAGPRGFCAGVERAILMVEKAIEKFGAPVYVRHQIVHNPHVVSRLEEKGAIFVKQLSDIPDTQQPVLFSAHGVSKDVVAEAQERNFFHLDATCPLVTKVHREVDLHDRLKREVIMIGHAGHAEVLGTTGQLPPGQVLLVETVNDVATLQVKDPDNLAYVTQTTLSVDETADIIAALTDRFPNINAPKKEDICYATTNRQGAVKNIAPRADLFIVVGAKNSSNSNRLKEAALSAGAKNAYLIDDVTQLDWSWFEGVKTLGLSSGASAPDDLVQDIITACQERFATTMEDVIVFEEDVTFNLPRILAA
ncbi:MAG TPA: 4-hydroxy-3-methylbut-2-enyl diphosphate reductase [Alphaproteobacteria bacterium]